MNVDTRSVGDKRRTSRRRYRKALPVQVAEPPRINGPLPVEDDPSIARYEIVAQLCLPDPDSDATPITAYVEQADGVPYLDVRWTTTDPREPRGIWERRAVITLPRQFVVKAYSVTDARPILQAETGA